jgi:hypothetical protein
MLDSVGIATTSAPRISEMVGDGRARKEWFASLSEVVEFIASFTPLSLLPHSLL